MIIVIPCHNEPDLIGTLESLLACEQLDYIVEVIVVVNEEAGSQKTEIGRQNRKTLSDFRVWNREHETLNLKNKRVSGFRFHVIEALDLPNKTAGVGLARKTGMDEALRRFLAIDTDGIIVCLDADCRVSKNYIKAIHEQFVLSDGAVGEVHFEHLFEEETDPDLKQGIINYELFLRYYVEGLRQAKFPNAIHTIGSCMLVKASIYAKHGGMNKRKAGEDFYFLHKIVPHEHFVQVDQATVYPSCRTSDRVPFGTGKAQNHWLRQEGKLYPTYDPRIFEDLRVVNKSVNSLFEKDFDLWVSELTSVGESFFKAHQYSEKIALIKANCKTMEQFVKQFYTWFDGFLCLKFVHFSRDEFYSNVPLEHAASSLIDLDSSSPIQLLSAYKELDLRPVAS